MAAPLTSLRLEESAEELSRGVVRWEAGSFGYLRNLQQAVRNRGRVELMRCKQGANSGRLVAVKRMPNAWVQHGPRAHEERFPKSAERPWRDLGILQELNRRSFPGACELLGLFRDDDVTYVVTSLATEGELFDWCKRAPAPGKEREAQMAPLVRQIFTSVRMLHDHGIAHCDLSLENILLTKAASGELQVKLIDFGMSTAGRMRCSASDVGKPSYQAPEIHLGRRYDAFLADSFALGVVICTMALREYPWASTKRGKCPRFDKMHYSGWKTFTEDTKLRDGTSQPLCQVFSRQLRRLLGALLQTEPARRAHLGEACFSGSEDGEEEVPARPSVWDFRWHDEATLDAESESDEDSDAASLDEAASSDADEAVSPTSADGAAVSMPAAEGQPDSGESCGLRAREPSAGSSSASTAASRSSSRSSSPCQGGRAEAPEK